MSSNSPNGIVNIIQYFFNIASTGLMIMYVSKCKSPELAPYLAPERVSFSFMVALKALEEAGVARATEDSSMQSSQSLFTGSVDSSF